MKILEKILPKFKNMRSPVAVEINEEFLKLVTAKPFVKSRQASDCIVKPIAGLSDKQITEQLSGLLRELKLKPSPLVVSIPRNFVTVRNLHLPSQDKNEILQMLQLHMGRIVPYRKEEIVFGYSLLGFDEMKYAKLILAIVHNSVLKRLLNILQAADLYIDRINLSSYGVWEWVNSSQRSEIGPEDIYLILDIDTTFTDLIVASRDHLLYTRSITMDTKNGFQENQITKLIGEVRQSLVVFHNENNQITKNYSKIFLSGAYLICDLERVIKKEFDAPIKCVAPPYSLEELKSKQRVIPDNVSLSSSAELILEDTDKRISFTLPEIQIRRNLRDRTRELTVLAALIIYFFSILLALFWGKFYNQQAYLNRLIEENKLIEADMGELLSEYKTLNLVKNFLYHRKIPLAFIYELQKTIPRQIAVTYLNIDPSGMVTLRGQGVELSDVFKFISTLEASEFFQDVTTKNTRKKKLKDKEITDFEITFKPEIEVEDPGS